MQKNQVIGIKDTTIMELQNEQGLRSSQGVTSRKREETRSVAILAMPETNDAKCQTYGPRKTSYYRSIPAKIKTNLPDRSPSTSVERNQYSSLHLSNSLPPTKRNQKVSQEYPSQRVSLSPSRVTRKNMISNSSHSQNRRRNSPSKDTSLEDKTIEDVKSLRLQLTSLKKQLNAQEEDNITLIQMVTALQETIDSQEKNYDVQSEEVKRLRLENTNLSGDNEELIKQVDSLRVECTELRHAKSPTLRSEQFELLLQERRDRISTDCSTQTEDLLWSDWALQAVTRLKSEANLQELLNDQITTGPVTSRSGQLALGFNSHQKLQGQGIICSRENSRLLDQLSEVLSGEQGNAHADYERIIQLVDRANSYEKQQNKIEKEIDQYKQMIQEVQQLQSNKCAHTQPLVIKLDSVNQQNNPPKFQPEMTYNHVPQQQKIKNDTSLCSQYSTMSPMDIKKLKEYTGVGTLNQTQSQHQQQHQFSQGNLPFQTGSMATIGFENLNEWNLQQISVLQTQLNYQTRKYKKLARKYQRLQIEKQIAEKTSHEAQIKFNEVNERYQDLRTTHQFKLQKKNMKISDLKSQINSLRIYGPKTLNNSFVHQVDKRVVAEPHKIPKPYSTTVNIMHQKPHASSFTELIASKPLTMLDKKAETLKFTAASEANKGQKAPNEKKKTRGFSATEAPLIQLNVPKKSSIVLSSSDDIYEVVQEMVDQRIAERSRDGNDFRAYSQGSAGNCYKGHKKRRRGKKKDLAQYI